MRTMTRSIAFAILAAVAIVAGPVVAGSSTPIAITLDVNFDDATEIITAQTNFCDGTAESVAWTTGGGANGGGNLVFHVGRVFTCEDGSTLTIKLDAAIARPHGGTVGGWTIVDGTGDFADAKGGGIVVGAFYDGGILDQYEGSLVR
jgi:hypothetical protein